MDITTLTVTELKALAFDTLARIDFEQKNLQIVQAQIQSKLSEEKPVEEKKDL